MFVIWCIQAIFIPRDNIPSVPKFELIAALRKTHTMSSSRSISPDEYTPPIAVQKPHKVTFGAVKGENRGENPFRMLRYRDDPWFWLRDDKRNNEEVLKHLKKENSYTEVKTKHLKAFEKKLYNEHISHLKETDEDPPFVHGKYFYYTRTVEGKSYKIHCRKEASDFEGFYSKDTKEEVILDENLIAEGHEQCNINVVEISPDHTMLAYSVDFKGSETYTIRLVDLLTGLTLPDKVKGTSGYVEWGGDTQVIFYVTEDEAKRPYKLWKHVVGTEQTTDINLFTEEDEIFYLGIFKSKDGQYLFISSESTETSEISFIDLKAAQTELVTIQKREKGLRYNIEHLFGNSFIIWTNINDAVNNRLMLSTLNNLSKNNWKEILPYDSLRQIKNVEVFSKFVAIEGRQDGLTQIWTLKIAKDGDSSSIDPSTLKKIKWPEKLYKCKLGTNKEYNTTSLRIIYSSLTTPSKWQDFHMMDNKMTLVKQKEILNFDSSLYVVKQMMAKANDGTLIPISMVYKKDVSIKNGDTPTMLYGYGSYGSSVDPGFDRMIIPYLDRGMVYAIAHIRGGGEMGRPWYEEKGKYLNKRNTFSDFINCAEHLIQENVTKPEKLAIEGRSAGGMLIGTVLNMRPDLFKIAVAGVPFVDVMNTMSDPSIPLTTGEWEEWGNPNEDKYFDYMLSYSPYDNVREQPYPHILITCGLHDPRVAYWEPTKWAAKLKTLKTDKNEVLLKTDLEAGHFSASDRYKKIKETSFNQAVVLRHLGLID